MYTNYPFKKLKTEIDMNEMKLSTFDFEHNSFGIYNIAQSMMLLM